MEHETRVMNTEEIEREMSNLSPCKHCGSTTAPRLISRQDFEVEHGARAAGTDRASGESFDEGYAVICSAVADPPGCGSMSGWGGTNENDWTMNGKDGAIAAWNRAPDRIES